MVAQLVCLILLLLFDAMPDVQVHPKARSMPPYQLRLTCQNGPSTCAVQLYGATLQPRSALQFLSSCAPVHPSLARIAGRLRPNPRTQRAQPTNQHTREEKSSLQFFQQMKSPSAQARDSMSLDLLILSFLRAHPHKFLLLSTLHLSNAVSNA